MKKYSIVGFPEEKGQPVEVVPTSWRISKTVCLFPPRKIHKAQFRSLVEDCLAPGADWPKHKIKLYGSSRKFCALNYGTNVKVVFNIIFFGLK